MNHYNMLARSGLLSIVFMAAYGCSRGQPVIPMVDVSQEDLPSKLWKEFDVSSLTEVKDVGALPPEIKERLAPGQSITVWGLSKTSALVAYPVGDFVPMYEADAYVFHSNKWIKVHEWSVYIPSDSTLPQLLQGIKNVETPAALDLESTLSQLNVSNPVTDLDRNLAQDKTYFIGLCEPPGHTPGVSPSDEELVHTSKHGLWCLPGSGDPITTAKYGDAIARAREYSSRYNAELLRRIHERKVP